MYTAPPNEGTTQIYLLRHLEIYNTEPERCDAQHSDVDFG